MMITIDHDGDGGDDYGYLGFDDEYDDHGYHDDNALSPPLAFPGDNDDEYEAW